MCRHVPKRPVPWSSVYGLGTLSADGHVDLAAAQFKTRSRYSSSSEPLVVETKSGVEEVVRCSSLACLLRGEESDDSGADQR